ncbi:MAG: aminotransferase class I/II-fold pyridoxal phosphate-dependent enzyme [Clostridiales bacterium]|nr:aminotransferase class I/II-fold pyridoxal phosphate-dependent enzyme [Clostridiales bacterium]MCF8022521.1 aminotransferase class I/II-fold pyridoxal phosphate-dependent enzyme [Clostridiales bacterium]
MKNMWEEKLSPVVKSIPPSGIRKFFDLVSETRGVISLGVGEPDFVTPWHIREAAIYAIEQGYTMYTSNYGLLELREVIRDDIYKNYEVQYDPRAEILVTVGVSEALDLAMRAVICPGDEVLIPEPSYVSYAPTAVLAGGKPVFMQTTMDNNFVLTPEQVEKSITPRTKVLMISYPNNPTGAVMDRETMLGLAEVAKKHDLIIISDEIYDKLNYTGEQTCMAALPGMRERTILLNGFSKAYAMTGWRIAYAAAHADFISAMTKIHQYSILCTPISAQMAAMEALKNGDTAMKKMVREFNRRRHLVLQGFKDMGLPCFEPGGAFYAFPNIEVTGLSSEEFAEQLLQEAQVATVPGSAFGDAGEGYIRVSYASSIEDISEALRRMGKFVRRRGVFPKKVSTSSGTDFVQKEGICNNV